MARGETHAHRSLKRLAFAWAQQAGLTLAASEVRIPRSGYRADVAAATRSVTTESGRVAVFECKQSRADLLRDRADEPATRAQAEALAARVHALRAAVASHRPDLRRGEALFAEFDSYDLAGLRHDTLAALERELAQLQQKLLASVKFSRLRSWGAADYLYLVTTPGIVAAHEVPDAWGWLVADEASESLSLALPPVRLATTPESRLAWLETIARSGSRDAAHRLGVPKPSATREPAGDEQGT